MEKEKHPVCEKCDKVLDDWMGNIMVPKSQYPDKIPYIQIWCKKCTVKLDEVGPGRDYHNLWELNWMQDFPERVRSIFEDMKYEPERWSDESLNKIIELGKLTTRFDEL